MIRFPLLHLAAAALVSAIIATTAASAGDDVGAPGSPSAPTAPDELVTVVVKLDEEPVARYRGGIRGLAATSRAATGATKLDPR